MASERKTGAGSYLGGVLERAPQPRAEKPEPPDETDASAQDAGPKGKPSTASKPRPAPPARTLKRIKGRTVYLPDDLFERIIVQAHRKNRTISEYVVGILERQVPDHRVIRAKDAEPAETDVTSDTLSDTERQAA